MDNSPGRREAKKFEPPPWEQEQFEELQRRRAEEQAAAETEGPVVEETARADDAPVADEPPVHEAADGGGEAAAAPSGQTEEPAAGLDEKMVTRMLAELSAEEPRKSHTYQTVAMVFSVFVITLGSVLLIWGIVGAMRTIGSGPTGILGGTILIVMGVSFISMGAWTAYRSLQQRGVL